MVQQRKEKNEKAVVTNRKAYHDYFIEEKFEAGIMLQGTEVKSLREGRVNLQDSYASVKDERGLSPPLPHQSLQPRQHHESRASPYSETAPPPQGDQ